MRSRLNTTDEQKITAQHEKDTKIRMTGMTLIAFMRCHSILFACDLYL